MQFKTLEEYAEQWAHHTPACLPGLASDLHACPYSTALHAFLCLVLCPFPPCVCLCLLGALCDVMDWGVTVQLLCGMKIAQLSPGDWASPTTLFQKPIHPTTPGVHCPHPATKIACWVSTYPASLTPPHAT